MKFLFQNEQFIKKNLWLEWILSDSQNCLQPIKHYDSLKMPVDLFPDEFSKAQSFTFVSCSIRAHTVHLCGPVLHVLLPRDEG